MVTYLIIFVTLTLSAVYGLSGDKASQSDTADEANLTQ